MKKLMLLFLLISLTGCYINRPEMYQARTAYYEAQVAAYQAQSARAEQPLVSMTMADGGILNVGNQLPVPLPVIKQVKNGWVDFSKAVLNSTPLGILAGGWSAKQLLKNSGGNVEIHGDGNTASPISNSYNTETIDIATVTGDESGLDQHADSSDQSRIDNSDNSDNSDNRADYNNQTAIPTVVNQPEPIIVNPVVVDPVVVDPVVVDPVVVNPVVINNDSPE